MANGVKTYQIQINGITESVKAVESLNKQLSELEARIKALEGKSVGVKTSGGGSKSSSTGSLSEEEKIQKQIEQIDAKRVAYSKEIYQNYLAAKDVLKETVKDQNAIAASERLQANSYSNTIMGMKQELADIKSAMQTVDLGDTEKMGEMVKRANELNDALKKIEESYGQFGRNVGNYKSAADGFTKVRVQVGNTIREFNSAREASRQLNMELKSMAVNGQQDTQAFKELQKAVMQMESAMNDAKKPLDDVMDTMQSLVALVSVSKGLSAFFGIDDSEIQRSLQKLVALQNVMKGLDTLIKQMKTGEGVGSLFSSANRSVDLFVAKITGAKLGVDGLTKSTKAATYAVKGLSLALKGVGIGLLLMFIEKAIPTIEKWGEEITKSADKTKLLDNYLGALNKTYETRRDLLTSSYLKGELSDEEFLSKQYDLQNDYLSKQVNLLRERFNLMNSQKDWSSYLGLYGNESETDYRGGKLTGSTSVRSYNPLYSLDETAPTLKITIKTVEELDEQIKKCNDALKENKDYFSKWGKGIGDWINSLFTTVDDTEDALNRLAEIRIGDFVARFGEINDKFKNNKISAEEFGKELSKLKNEMNNNEILSSIIANLDKYIPDEKSVEAINNIINAIIQLDDSFNMTSPEQIHHWAQVRIDAMKEGIGKSKAQIDADEKYEIARYGKTQEQINLIKAKYNRKRQEAEDKHNKEMKSKAEQGARELENVIRETNALRIELMSEGFDKELAKLDEEKRQRVKKAKEAGVSVELVEKVYAKKLVELRNKWAEDVEQVYVNMWKRIHDLNYQNSQLDFENQKRQIEKEAQDLRDAASNKLAGGVSTYSIKGATIDENNNLLIERDIDYTKRLSAEYNKRISERKKYYDELEKISIDEENRLFDLENKAAVKAMDNELRTLKNGYKSQDREMKKHYDEGKLTLEQYKEATERLEKERADNEAEIQIKYQTQAEERERNHQEKIDDIRNGSYNKLINEYSEFFNNLSRVDISSPIINKLGFTNITAIKNRNNEVLQSYKKLANDIDTTISNLESKLKRTDLTQNQRDSIEDAIKKLKELKSNVNSTAEGIKDATKNLIQSIVGEINQYLQALGQSLMQIMSAVWDAEDAQFEKEQELLDKMNEELDKKLDEQQDIVQQHKDAVNSIEDELATARGDRRQHLIDQINAEMAAQRAAQKQAQKIAKEQEALDKKQEKLDKERRKAEYKRNMLQAVVNGALAVTMAAVNAWPMPAIAMMALAGAATAAQIAIMASNKPYAKGGQLDGGVAVGNRHRDGGIKVLGGRAEIEGGEFVTNRLTTEKNIDLLDYINSKKKRINLDDLMEFYSSGKVKRNISSISPKAKFADGGTIPTISNDYAFDDRLISAFEDYSNRPVVVSVVDINNRQSAVKNVQVLAGLSE